MSVFCCFLVIVFFKVTAWSGLLYHLNCSSSILSMQQYSIPMNVIVMHHAFHQTIVHPKTLHADISDTLHNLYNNIMLTRVCSPFLLWLIPWTINFMFNRNAMVHVYVCTCVCCIHYTGLIYNITACILAVCRSNPEATQLLQDQQIIAGFNAFNWSQPGIAQGLEDSVLHNNIYVTCSSDSVSTIIPYNYSNKIWRALNVVNWPLIGDF